MRVGDLTVEQYLGITQAWGTGVWLVTVAIVTVGAWLWRKRRAKQEIVPLPPDLDDSSPRCIVCGARCSPQVYELAQRVLYVRGDWEEALKGDPRVD